MDTSSQMIPAGEALAEVERLLDLVDPDRSGLDERTRLGWVRLARRVRGRVDALTGLLVGEADGADASMQAAGTPLTSWLGMQENLSRREAAGVVHQARALTSHPLVGAAATAGKAGPEQVRAITRLLADLAPQLDSLQLVRAEQLLVDLAGHLDADQLAKSAGHVLEQVAPANADELVETRLQREAEAAHRRRSLRFFREGASVRFDGSLPRMEAEAWIAVLEAHAEARRRSAIEARDPLAEQPTPAQRRADAMIAMIGALGRGTGVTGGGMARVTVRLDYEALLAGAAGAGLLGDGLPLSAGELRRLCCEADLIPLVLGTSSEVLDVGRAGRLVTPAIRTALVQRDGGCAFPGCDVPASLCEAHHVRPWWAGGSTSLDNFVLLCRHHHALVEPARQGLRDQWQVRIAIDGLPEFIPPARQDPRQLPVRHRRRDRTSQSSGGDCRAGPPAA